MSDYTIDWSNTNVDGNNTIAGPDGDIQVSVATPQNGEGKEWFVENGMLKNWDVTQDSSADITFSEEVTNVTFTLLDVDRLDEITIMTKDEHGNPVEVQFEATGVHDVNGNVVTGTQTNAPGPGATNNGQDINITIPGPLTSFWIVLDDGPERNYSGTVAVSDIHFDIADQRDGYVEGGAGNDTIDVAYTGDPDGDQIDNGDALLPGEAAQDDIVLAGAGDDFVMAGDGNDEIYGGEGDDTLCGQDGNDVIYGGTGNDILEGMNNDDVLIGGDGNDSIYGDAGEDIISGGAGDDKIVAGADDDIASGGKGDDYIKMGSGNDVAYGGVGADSILGGAGNDTLIGGNMAYDGTQDFNDLSAGDLVDGQYIAEGVTITSDDPRTPVMAFDTANPTGGDTDLATDNLGKVLILSEDRDGADPDDNASGGAFNINFENPAHVTSLTLLDVEAGAWVKYYDMDGNLLQQVDVTTANNGQYVVTTDLSNVASIKVILAGSGAIDNLSYSIDPDNMDGADVISGGSGDDYIEGNVGNDDLSGDGGDDTVYGGAGDDDISGGAGEDFLLGGDGDDTIEGGADDDTLCGNDGDDVLYGGAGDDILEGMGDDDMLFGGVGNDTLYGDAGDDTLTGGDGEDIIKGGSGSDLIFGSAGDTVDGGATGTDNDVLDLTGQGPFYLENVVSDTTTGGNGNGINGTVVFVDGDGNPTGETLSFTDIEEILGDEVNRGPDANDDSATVDEDGSVNINVLGNDTDPDGDTLTVTDATSPNGTVTINPDGTLTFEPDDNFNGDTTITYTVDDGNGGTDTATVNVSVTPVNDDPLAVDDVASTDEDTSVIIDLISNDTDVDGDPLSIGAVSVPADQGTVVDNGDGTVTFTPAENFNGPATITYTVVDGQGGSDEGQAVVSVGAVNDGPVANDDSDTTDEDTPITVDLIDNDTDDDGDALTVISATVPADQGTLEDNGDGTVTFTPAENFNGEATISYEISDGNGGTDTAEHTITVTPVNDAPDAVDSAYVVDQSEAFGDEDANAITDDTGDGVDSDPEGDDLTVVAVAGDAANVGGVVAGDSGGQFIINDDGTVDFNANGDFDGLGEGETASTSVTYTIADEDGLTDTATVTFTVTGTNDGPVAVEDAFTTDEDTVSELGNVLGNDSDPDGDPLTVGAVNGDDTLVGTPVAGSAGGLVTINPDGTVSFDPNGEFDALSPGESVETTVTYTVTDPSGAEATETVTITVNGVNDGPDATDNAYTVSLTETTGDVDGNVITDDTGDGVDSDPEGDVLTVVAVDGVEANVGTAVAGDAGGTFIINPDGTVDFDAGDDFDDLGLGATRDTSVTYTIVDENGAVDTATATFTVTGINDGTVQGTAGNDVINPDIPYVDADGDIVDAGDGILPGDEGTDNDVIEGFGGDDTIDAGAGDDVVFGGTGDDSITGNIGDDELYGGDGEDIVRGGEGDDTLDGGADDDMLFGGAGDDTIDGGDGDDKIEGGSGDDTIIGGEGNDDLWGASGDDSVDGGAGDDTIATAQGNDIVEGGDGDDIIDTSNDESPLTGQNLPDVGYPGVYPADIDPNDDLDTVFGGAGDDSITTGDDNDTIFGGTGDDTIDAGIDDDFVEGGEGDDTIIGSEGNDEIYGEDGDDTIYGGLVPGGPLDALNLPDDLDGDGDSNDPGEDLVTDNNNDTLFGGAGDDTIYGADDDDTLYGGTGDDVLDGGVDDDTIEGGEGNDTIIGGQGDDDQFGGLGNDTFLGGNGGDVVVGGEDPDADGDGQSDDVDVLDLTGSNVDFITYVDGDPEAGEVTFLDGSTMTFSEIENVIPCFTPGTTIATPKGERLVEELREGDRIITRDNGIQEIRWIGRKEMSGKSLVANPHLKPILIRAGSLGNGLPERDMLVSPNHRMLVASEKTQLYFEEREVLAAAKHLVGSDGIHAVDVMGTAYIHFMFDRHEVVLSNGAWTESFQPGDYSLKGIGNSQRNEIFELFPELQSQVGLEGYQSARRALKKHEARLLVK